MGTLLVWAGGPRDNEIHHCTWPVFLAWLWFFVFVSWLAERTGLLFSAVSGRLRAGTTRVCVGSISCHNSNIRIHRGWDWCSCYSANGKLVCFKSRRVLNKHEYSSYFMGVDCIFESPKGRSPQKQYTFHVKSRWPRYLYLPLVVNNLRVASIPNTCWFCITYFAWAVSGAVAYLKSLEIDASRLNLISRYLLVCNIVITICSCFRNVLIELLRLWLYEPRFCCCG